MMEIDKDILNNLLKPLGFHVAFTLKLSEKDAKSSA